MTQQEIIKMLVETDDKMERMRIVEENKEMLMQEAREENSEEDFKAKFEEVSTNLTNVTAELEALKQKYIDTFFKGGDNETEPEIEPTQEEAEKERANTITIDDLIK